MHLCQQCRNSSAEHMRLVHDQRALRALDVAHECAAIEAEAREQVRSPNVVV